MAGWDAATTWFPPGMHPVGHAREKVVRRARPSLCMHLLRAWRDGEGHTHAARSAARTFQTALSNSISGKSRRRVQMSVARSSSPPVHAFPFPFHAPRRVPSRTSPALASGGVGLAQGLYRHVPLPFAEERKRRAHAWLVAGDRRVGLAGVCSRLQPRLVSLFRTPPNSVRTKFHLPPTTTSAK